MILGITSLIQVHLWDLSGDEQYYDVRTELYGGADACFLVFDVANSQSFKNLGIHHLNTQGYEIITTPFVSENWIKEMGKHGALSSRVVLVGNKADLRANVRL